jgi:glutamine amidotransferase PdxT
MIFFFRAKVIVDKLNDIPRFAKTNARICQLKYSKKIAASFHLTRVTHLISERIV